MHFLKSNVIVQPIVTLRMDPPSPIIENHNVNVTLHCDVESGNPSTLLKVQWMVNGTLLKELPECKGDTQGM